MDEIVQAVIQNSKQSSVENSENRLQRFISPPVLKPLLLVSLFFSCQVVHTVFSFKCNGLKIINRNYFSVDPRRRHPHQLFHRHLHHPVPEPSRGACRRIAVDVLCGIPYRGPLDVSHGEEEAVLGVGGGVNGGNVAFLAGCIC